jgi:AAA family ATP:ADP antiporter
MTTLSILQAIARPIFGTFEREEFKKFLRMGLIFSFIIGSYWTIRTLKNALFMTLVGAGQLPYAKTLSLFFLLPVIMTYTKLLDKYSREKIFYILSTVYGVFAVLFGISFAYTQGMDHANIGGFLAVLLMIIGYGFYLFVESYGSLMPALFWAIASDTTVPDSAKKGFSFIVAIGQFGGIFGPFMINSLPRRLGLTTSALSLYICAGAMIISMYLFRNFFKKTPKELLVSYHGKNEQKEEKMQEAETGFFEGLRLLINHKYLLAVFAVIAFPEIIGTIFDLHFNSLASQHYSGVHLAEYLGMYGSAVNITAFLFLIFGIGNITRVLGLGVSLLLMPIIYGAAVFGFITLNSLNFLFILMASSKAINYALNGPAIKQLYIPTTHNVRFKSQAWMETFGSRGAKEAGSIFNMSLAPMQAHLGVIIGRARHAMYASYLSFALVILWVIIALFLGRQYKAAIDEKRVVC